MAGGAVLPRNISVMKRLPSCPKILTKDFKLFHRITRDSFTAIERKDQPRCRTTHTNTARSHSNQCQ